MRINPDVEKNIIKNIANRAANFCDQLIAKLQENGHKVETSIHKWGEEKITFILKIDDISPRFNIRKQKTNDMHYTLTGKFTVSIGGAFSKTKTYVEPKNGFDIEKMFTRIIKTITEEKEKSAEEQQRLQNISSTEQVVKKIEKTMSNVLGVGVAQISSVIPGNHFRGTKDQPRSLPLVSIEMSIEEATEVAYLLAEMRNK